MYLFVLLSLSVHHAGKEKAHGKHTEQEVNMTVDLLNIAFRRLSTMNISPLLFSSIHPVPFSFLLFSHLLLFF